MTLKQNKQICAFRQVISWCGKMLVLCFVSVKLAFAEAAYFWGYINGRDSIMGIVSVIICIHGVNDVKIVYYI